MSIYTTGDCGHSIIVGEKRCPSCRAIKKEKRDKEIRAKLRSVTKEKDFYKNCAEALAREIGGLLKHPTKCSTSFVLQAYLREKSERGYD